MKQQWKVKAGAYVKTITVEVEEENGNWYVYSAYDVDLLEELRSFKGGRFDGTLKCWIIPKNERNQYAMDYLSGIRPSFPPVGDTWVTSRPLFEHQRAGLNFIYSRRRCMLAFEMGLGKTLVGLEFIEWCYQGDKINWWLIAPYGAQQEWKRQIAKWNSPVRFALISTYESLCKAMEDLPESYVPDGVIFDESVKLKNPFAQRSQVAYELAAKVRAKNGYVLLFSGCPAPREPTDWWHQIEIIQPGFLREGDIYKFRKRYANIVFEDGEFGKYPKIESWKEDEVAKLGKRISPLVLVKRKKDCFNLPEKIYDTILCSSYLTPEELMELQRVGEVLINTSKSGIEALERLRELSDGFQYHYGDDPRNSTDTPPDNDTVAQSTGGGGRSTIVSGIAPKLTAVKELLDFYHTDNGGPGRLVIYAAYQGSIDLVAEVCNKNDWQVFRIDGRGWSDEKILEKFDDPTNFPNCVVCANPACVHGLSLVRTEALVYYSNNFNVDYRIQSSDRRDRPGMDTTRGTRIVDLINLPTDQYILDRLRKGISIQDITLEEVRKCLVTLMQC